MSPAAASRELTKSPVLYRSLMTDNTRWNALQLRAGDIILSTPSKCGMTWTQRLVSLLVFDGPDLPGPLSTVSPWLDQAIRPIDEVVEVLDAQNHRRFIKTHTPLDGLPYDDGVTYLCVGRDPRDAAVSMLFQTANTDHERMRALIRGVSPAPDFRGDAEKFRAWMEGPALPPPGTGPGLPRGIGTLANILHHFGKTWERRDLANVALFHFRDYQSNLVAELMRLARVLEIDLRRDRACELARHASLETMRSRAWEMAPNSTDGVWLSDERFFRRGGRGDWRDYLSRRDTWRYYHRIKELAPPDLLAWAHGGRHGWDPAA